MTCSYFQGLTMDVILQCAFGIQADSQNNPNEPAITAAKRAISGQTFQRVIITILSLLPFGGKIINAFPRILTHNMEELLNISKQIIAAKKSAESNSSRKVIITLLFISVLSTFFHNVGNFNSACQKDRSLLRVGAGRIIVR